MSMWISVATIQIESFVPVSDIFTTSFKTVWWNSGGMQTWILILTSSLFNLLIWRNRESELASWQSQGMDTVEMGGSPGMSKSKEDP